MMTMMKMLVMVVMRTRCWKHDYDVDGCDEDGGGGDEDVGDDGDGVKSSLCQVSGRQSTVPHPAR